MKRQLRSGKIGPGSRTACRFPPDGWNGKLRAVMPGQMCRDQPGCAATCSRRSVASTPANRWVLLWIFCCEMFREINTAGAKAVMPLQRPPGGKGKTGWSGCASRLQNLE